MKTFGKIWSVVSTVLVIIVVISAVFLLGSRLLGFKVFTVISGSMEPQYSVGDLIYVKEVDPNTIKVGDPITFVLNEDLVVATHRVIEVNTEKSYFRTKGDANQVEDASPVHFKNVIGVPQFSIPFLGYVSDFIQHPPGMYITIGVIALMIVLAFLPDFGGKDKKGETAEQTPAAEVEKNCRNCKYYWKDVDLPKPVCLKHKFQFDGDHDPCDDFKG